MTSTPAWISLGSNLGDRRAILDAAMAALGQTPGIAVSALSSYRETRPVGGPPGQGPFLNAAARLDTTLGPRELLHALQAIEADLGRVRTVRWGERTLDLDILMFGSKFVDEPDLKLPHPRLAVRRFVLEPLAEIAPAAFDTITRRTMADLLVHLNGTARIVLLDESILTTTPAVADQLAARLSADLLDAVPIDFAAMGCRGPSPPPGFYRDLLSGLIALGAASPSPSSRWTVARFAIDPSRLKRTFSIPSEFHRDEALLARAADEEPSFWLKLQVARHLELAPDPAFLVATPTSKWMRRPNLTPTPVYWPEATDPDAIVAEVVAVCRGIEAS